MSLSVSYENGCKSLAEAPRTVQAGPISRRKPDRAECWYKHHPPMSLDDPRNDTEFVCEREYLLTSQDLMRGLDDTDVRELKTQMIRELGEASNGESDDRERMFDLRVTLRAPNVLRCWLEW